jgi:hypothetical protein
MIKPGLRSHRKSGYSILEELLQRRINFADNPTVCFYKIRRQKLRSTCRISEVAISSFPLNTGYELRLIKRSCYQEFCG